MGRITRTDHALRKTGMCCAFLASVGNRFFELTLLWLVFHLLDTGTTALAFRLGLGEVNPIPATVLTTAGVGQFFAWKWLWVGWIPLFCRALQHRWRLWPALQIGTMAAQMAVINNLIWISMRYY